MPAVNFSQVVARETGTIMKRAWPKNNVGPMVVFCIVGVVAIGLIFLWISKCLAKRKANKPVQ